MSTSAGSGWERVLDSLESSLDDPVPVPEQKWQAPDVGPLPDTLRTRAEQLLERQQERIAGLQQALAEVSRQLEQLRPRATVGRAEAAAVYVDTRA